MKGLFSKVIGGLSPSCRQMAQLCSQSLDRKLSLWERIQIRMHCWICSWCVDYSYQVNQVSNIVRNEGESLAEIKSDKLSVDCKARIRAMMEQSANDIKKID